MAGDRIEPLIAELWFESLDRLARLESSSARLESRLRLAYHLTALAPLPFSSFVHCRWDEEVFERLLESAAYEAAAVGLLGEVLSFAVTRDPEKAEVLASVWLVELAGKGRCSSDNVASALIGAWLEFLLAFKDHGSPAM